jgi:hypothetical protein
MQLITKLFSSGRSAFRVRFKDTSVGTHRTFIATNEHVRKHWMDCIKQVIQQQENIKVKCSSPPEAKKKVKSVLPCKRMKNKAPLNENDSQPTRPFRQQNRISKSIMKDILV